MINDKKYQKTIRLKESINKLVKNIAKENGIDQIEIFEKGVLMYIEHLKNRKAV